MKKPLLLIGLVVLLSPLVHAGQYDGKWENITSKTWENITSKYSCKTGGVSYSAYSYLFNDDIVILNNKVKMGNLKTIGKVKRNLFGVDTIGMNTRYGHLGGKIKNNSMQLKFTPTFDSWKPLGKCTYRFVKVYKTQQNQKTTSDFADSGFCKIYPKASPCLTDSKVLTIAKKKTSAKKNDFCEIYPKASPCLKSSNNIVKQESKKINKTKKTVQTVIVKNDTIGPEIIVHKTFEANQYLTTTIKGKVRDESEIALVSVHGHPVSVNKGSFSKTLFVKPGGQIVDIVSIDVHGNRSTATVELKRTTVTVVSKQFDSPDPRKLIVETNPNAVALIIGVEDYENTVSAPFAKEDALAFNDFARMSLGVPQNNIKLLINDEAGLIDTLTVVNEWLPKVVDENKTDLYVFFSGHGLASEDGKDLFLLPSDGNPKGLEYSALKRNQVFDSIAKLNPRSVTVFLDTCYSGATRSEEFLVASKPIFIEVAEQEIPDNFTVFSASAGKETAKILEEAKHGLFSYFLMKGLEGKADTNNDQQITNGELISFINKQVSRQASQTPQLAGDASRILVQW